MSTIVDRIDSFLTGAVLTESKHEELAVKILKTSGLVPDGEQPVHIARGIAKAHGIPMSMVPQTVHYAAADIRERDAYDNERLAIIKAKSPPGGDLTHSDLFRVLSKRPVERVNDMKEYAALGRGERRELSDPISSAQVRSRLESAKDHALAWHELASHPKREAIVNRAVHAQVMLHDGSYTDDEISRSLDTWFKGRREAARQRGGVQGSRFSMEAHHAAVMKSIRAYNPMKMETWNPMFTGGKAESIHRAGEDGSALTDDEKHRRASRHTLEAAAQIIQDRKGLNIPFKHDAEHIHNGVTYKSYTLDTPDKANADCWGKKYCIATGTAAAQMNQHYHGGTYKPAHIITRMSTGDHGKPVEKLHAAYLPELLPSQQHRDYAQAVRNSGNNGPITGDDFRAIHPLLSKVDHRIDRDAHFYHSGNFTDA